MLMIVEDVYSSRHYMNELRINVFLITYKMFLNSSQIHLPVCFRCLPF